MPQSKLLKHTYMAIPRYYQAPRSSSEQHVTDEGAWETAFQRLLGDRAPAYGCLP